MARYLTRDKNELLVLTGAVYSFVAYLTAFTLEVLFIIDLAKQSPTVENSNAPSLAGLRTSNPTTFEDADDLSAGAAMSPFDQARLALESMQTHLTISCLAISVLYFLTFVASLLLVISLILRSTFMLLVWMCTVAALYLPELGLIMYVSIYGWGLDSRNGQTELIFYLLRAALNVLFIYRAHRLWKDWNYEKSFFLFSKSSKRFSAATYDSPYFIHGDSLSTTINPVFSSSTLHLDRYDQIRNSNGQSRGHSTTNESFFRPEHRNSYGAPQRGSSEATGYDLDDISPRRSFYLGNEAAATPSKRKQSFGKRPVNRQNSVLSFNNDDEFADCEMDLDYRTLTQQRNYSQASQTHSRQQVIPSTDYHQRQHYDLRPGPSSQHLERAGNNLDGDGPASPGGLSYSTQSLDRRHLKDMELNLPEQVILRPLGHQPFDYLYRPGSTTNLTSANNLSAQPGLYSSSSRLTRRDDFS